MLQVKTKLRIVVVQVTKTRKFSKKEECRLLITR